MCGGGRIRRSWRNVEEAQAYQEKPRLIGDGGSQDSMTTESPTLEGFSEKACRVIFFARYNACRVGSHSIEPHHLLLGLFQEDKHLMTRFLGSSKIAILREKIADLGRVGKISNVAETSLSVESRSVLDGARRERLSWRSPEICTEHIFLGLLLIDSVASKLLSAQGLAASVVREELQRIRAGSRTIPQRPTACRDCSHVILIEGSTSPDTNIFCGASPLDPVFNCYTGEFNWTSDRPQDQI